jgi:aspartate/methionine/tyrosine aminotransferase
MKLVMQDETPLPSDESLPRSPARRSAVPPFIVMDVISAAARREASGSSVIHMEVGQPGTPAPAVAREAVRRALERETLGYTEALGNAALRARIARHYAETYGVALTPERVIVTTGSSAAFVLAFLALFDDGDTVLLPSPGYPCYRHILSALGVRCRLIETGPSTRWMPTAQNVAEGGGSGAAGLLIASPSNPTGTMIEPARLRQLIEACRDARLWFISDEIYHGLTYTIPAETALEHSENAIVINSFSKYFSMTGWRIGWLVVPQALVRTVERLAQNLYISPPAVSQVAALAAFDGRDELEANRAVYAANRDLLLRELPPLGFDDIVPADGAFYLYADVSRLTDDSVAFARAMLEETGVAVTPGTDFDEARGSRFIRFSYSGTTAAMQEGLDRLARWERLKG